MAEKRADKRYILFIVAIIAVFVTYVNVWTNERNNVAMRRALSLVPVYFKKGQIDQAIIQYSNAIDYGADKSKYCYQRGILEQLTGHLFLAQGDYKRCLSLNPKDVNAMVNLSEIEYRLDDFDNAFKHADQALKYDPKNAAALTIRAMCYTRSHEYAKAVDDTTAALNCVSPNSAARTGILARRAAAYRYLGKNAEARQDIDAARKNFESQIARKSAEIFTHNDFTLKFVRPGFTLYSKATNQVTSPYIEFSERFLAYINENLFPLKKDPSLQIFLFRDPQSYEKALTANGEHPNGNGFYSPTYNAIFTFEQTDMGALGRALVSKAMSDMPFTDPWALTGIPDLFARVYGYAEGDSYHLYVGVQKPWLSEVLRKRLMRIDLPETLAQQYPGLTESEGRLAAVYLYRHGKLHQYLDLCRNGQVDQHVTLFETAFGKSAVQMEPEWSQYLLDFQKQNIALERLPDTLILRDANLYTQFLHAMPPGLLPPEQSDANSGNNTNKPSPANKPGPTNEPSSVKPSSPNKPNAATKPKH